MGLNFNRGPYSSYPYGLFHQAENKFMKFVDIGRIKVLTDQNQPFWGSVMQQNFSTVLVVKIRVQKSGAKNMVLYTEFTL